jgi:hypothetical protein
LGDLGCQPIISHGYVSQRKLIRPIVGYHPWIIIQTKQDLWAELAYTSAIHAENPVLFTHKLRKSIWRAIASRYNGKKNTLV